MSCRSETDFLAGRGVLQWLGEGSCSWEKRSCSCWMRGLVVG